MQRHMPPEVARRTRLVHAGLVQAGLVHQAPADYGPHQQQEAPMRDARQTGYTPMALPGVTPEEVIAVTTRTVGCDGGGGALGHPLVYMRIEARQVTCPYCSRTYVLADGAGDDHGH